MGKKTHVSASGGKGARHHVQQSEGNKANRKAMRSKKHNESDPEFHNLRQQLVASGFRLKSILGDGNCLFRALGDQLNDTQQDHMRHRQDVVNYIRQHREDFEPFVEDDVPFDKHITDLSKDGTFGGNDSIVAFSRLHNVSICIHQFNAAPWMVSADSHQARVLHIAYSNGDHYSSVERADGTGGLTVNVTAVGAEKKPDSKTTKKSAAATAAKASSSTYQYQEPVYNDFENDDSIAAAVAASAAQAEDEELMRIAMAMSMSAEPSAAALMMDMSAKDTAPRLTAETDDGDKSGNEKDNEDDDESLKSSNGKSTLTKTQRKSARQDKELAKMRRKQARFQEQKAAAAAAAGKSSSSVPATNQPTTDANGESHTALNVLAI